MYSWELCVIMSGKNQNVELLERNIVLLLNKLEENHYALQMLTEQLEATKKKANRSFRRE